MYSPQTGADPGFPVGGGFNLRYYKEILHEIEEILGREGVGQGAGAPGAPSRSTNAKVFKRNPVFPPRIV